MLGTVQNSDQARTISDLARHLQIPKSSAHQIAATLRYHGLLEQDKETRCYRLGPGLSHMASHRRYHVDLPELAHPYLEDLARTARMTALLGRRQGDRVVLIAKVESPDPFEVSAPIGHRIDARAGVFGKLFAAEIASADVEKFPSQLPPAFTTKSITNLEEYARDLQRVRERGYALDIEEYLDGVVAVGAAVRDEHGGVFGAFCLVGLAVSYGHRQLCDIGESVRGAAEGLCHELCFDRDQLPRPNAAHPSSGP